MSSKVEKLEKNKVKVEITVPVSEFEVAVDKAFRQNASKINIAGFRKGKAPRAIIEKMYGVEIMFEDAFNIITPEAYEKAGPLVLWTHAGENDAAAADDFDGRLML